MTLYNEIHPGKCRALEALIAAGHIPEGTINTKPIQEIEPDEVRGYEQYHAFAGIGGWPLALAIAGYNGPVWTGSCPCPPWSIASTVWGRQGQENDERDLWPVWNTHIGNAPVIIGEQVSSTVALRWYDRLADDLEAKGYAIGAADLPALCTGSPQRRPRLFFVAIHRRAGMEGLEPCTGARLTGSRRWGGQADLQEITHRPFQQSGLWPQPLVRADDDGTDGRTGALHSAGDAIDIITAAEFVYAAINGAIERIQGGK